MPSEFNQLTGMQHRITVAYNPQSNELVKRSHRTFEDMICKQVTPPDVNCLEILDCIICYQSTQAFFYKNKSFQDIIWTWAKAAKLNGLWNLKRQSISSISSSNGRAIGVKIMWTEDWGNAFY